MSYKNPAKPIFDLIKRQTTRLGSIGGLYNHVFQATDPRLSVSTGTRWYYVQARGATPSAIILDAASLGKAPGTAESVLGVTTFDTTSANPADGPVLIYTGVVPATTEKDGGSRTPIRIVAPGADIAVYVNNSPVLRGSTIVSVELLLNTGLNDIQIVIDNTPLHNVTIQVDPSLSIGLLPNGPGAPVWGDPAALYSYIGSNVNSGAVTLQWGGSNFAGGWALERTGYTAVASVISVDHDAVESTLTLLVTGSDHNIAGIALMLPDIVLGTILSVENILDEGDPNFGDTIVLVLTELEEDFITEFSGEWISELLFTSSTRGIIAEIGRGDVEVLPNGFFKFVDTGIKDSVPYSYRVRAYHPLHLNLASPWSEFITLLAIDIEPPGDITIISTQVVNGEMIVVYIPPIDIDYAGVTVYLKETEIVDLEEIVTYMPVHTDHGRPGIKDQLIFAVPDVPGTYAFKTFDWAGNVQEEGVEVEYDGNQNFIGGEGESLYFLWVREIKNTVLTTTLKVEHGLGIEQVAYWQRLKPWPDDSGNYLLEDELGDPVAENNGGILGPSLELTVIYPPPSAKRWVRFTGYGEDGLAKATVDVGIDPNTTDSLVPMILSAVVDGTKIKVTGSPGVRSLHATKVGGNWVHSVDGTYYEFDMASDDDFARPGIGSSEIWTVEIMATDEPRSSMIQGRVDQVTRTVSGSGVSGEAAWTNNTPRADAPPDVGGSTVTLMLQATSAPTGYYVYVWRRWRAGSPVWSLWEEIQSGLTPSLTAPPTTLTAYGDVGLSVRAVYGDIIDYEYRCEIWSDTDALVESKTTLVSYYIGEGLQPA
jgi:hypothetical protein